MESVKFLLVALKSRARRWKSGVGPHFLVILLLRGRLMFVGAKGGSGLGGSRRRGCSVSLLRRRNDLALFASGSAAAKQLSLK